MSDTKIEKFLTEDGRQAEKHVIVDGDKKVVEIHVESVRPKHLSHRIVEQSANVVVKREIETINEDGDVVERKVESIDPTDKMELREHIVKSDPFVTAQSADCDCYVTKEDLNNMASVMASQTKDAILAAAKTFAPVPNVSAMQIAVGEKVESESSSFKEYWVYIAIAAVAAGIVYVQWYM